MNITWQKLTRVGLNEAQLCVWEWVCNIEEFHLHLRICITLATAITSSMLLLLSLPFLLSLPLLQWLLSLMLLLLLLLLLPLLLLNYFYSNFSQGALWISQQRMQEAICLIVAAIAAVIAIAAVTAVAAFMPLLCQHCCCHCCCLCHCCCHCHCCCCFHRCHCCHHFCCCHWNIFINFFCTCTLNQPGEDMRLNPPAANNFIFCNSSLMIFKIIYFMHNHANSDIPPPNIIWRSNTHPSQTSSNTQKGQQGGGEIVPASTILPFFGTAHQCYFTYFFHLHC